MKTIILSLLLMLTISSSVLAQSSSLTLTEDPDGIQLNAQDVTLIDLLMELQQKSRIRFDLPEDMDATLVSFHLKAENWKSLVSTVMQDFNKIEVWSEKPGKSYVKIMGVGNYVYSAPRGPIYMPKKNPTSPTPDSEPVVTVKKTREPVRQEQEQIRLEQAKTDQDQAEYDSQEYKFNEIDPRAQMKEARAKAKAEREAREYVDPNHPMAKLPTDMLLEPGILNYLVAQGADIPDGFRNKYGIDENRMPTNYPIPPRVYNSPELKQYLAAVGLPKPPQFPNP